jgi:hypothetical protein
MSFALCSIGIATVIAALIYVARLMRLPRNWIAAGTLLLLGFGILCGAKATRQKDAPQ